MTLHTQILSQENYKYGIDSAPKDEWSIFDGDNSKKEADVTDEWSIFGDKVSKQEPVKQPDWNHFYGVPKPLENKARIKNNISKAIYNAAQARQNRIGGDYQDSLDYVSNIAQKAIDDLKEGYQRGETNV